MMIQAVLMVLFGTCLPATIDAYKTIQVVKNVLPYHQLMTPLWLYIHSTITGNHTLHPHYLELEPTTVIGQPKFEQALQVELVAPGILKSTDYITATITVAMDTALADSTDHDPSFGISDGKYFMGFTAYDEDNYASLSPCQQLEGEFSYGLLQSLRQIYGPLITSQHYSSEIKLQFRPTEQWGSCHTEHNEGYVNIAHYQYKFDLTKGLYLQMYHEDDPEKYRIKYIVVDIHVE